MSLKGLQATLVPSWLSLGEADGHSSLLSPCRNQNDTPTSSLLNYFMQNCRPIHVLLTTPPGKRSLLPHLLWLRSLNRDNLKEIADGVFNTLYPRLAASQLRLRFSEASHCYLNQSELGFLLVVNHSWLVEAPTLNVTCTGRKLAQTPPPASPSGLSLPPAQLSEDHSPPPPGPQRDTQSPPPTLSTPTAPNSSLGKLQCHQPSGGLWHVKLI